MEYVIRQVRAAKYLAADFDQVWTNDRSQAAKLTIDQALELSGKCQESVYIVDADNSRDSRDYAQGVGYIE